MGGEKKPLGMSELGCADGCGRRGCKGVAGNGWGEEATGDERAWLRGRLRTAWCKGVPGNGWGVEAAGDEASLAARTAADGVGAREWLEMGGEKKSLGMTASLAAQTAADGCGRRGCKGMIGNGWGEEAAGDERAWLRGRPRTNADGV